MKAAASIIPDIRVDDRETSDLYSVLPVSQMGDGIKQNEYNAVLKMKIADKDNEEAEYRRPRKSSFKNLDGFVYKAGAYVRDDDSCPSTPESVSRSGSVTPGGNPGPGDLPDFRMALKAKLRKEQMAFQPAGRMREMMETYKVQMQPTLLLSNLIWYVWFFSASHP